MKKQNIIETFDVKKKKKRHAPIVFVLPVLFASA